MDDLPTDLELPVASNLELALARRAAQIAAPLMGGTEFNAAMQSGYGQAAGEFISAGEDRAEVEAELARGLERFPTHPEVEVAEISSSLHAELLGSFERFLQEIPEGPVRLDEQTVGANTGFQMVIYPNESKHAGFPHVVVMLKDGTINISLENEPRVVAGKRGLRGEAAALAAVKAHRESLVVEWDNLRPDDQKIERRPKNESRRGKRTKRR